MFTLRILSPCLFLLGAATLLHAQDVLETLASKTPEQQYIDGHIDWTHKVITVYGEGLPPEGIANPAQRRLLGMRAAKAAAYRNLLEAIGEVQIDARTTVQMAMLADDSLSTRVRGMVRGARVVPESHQQVDGVYRIALRLELLDPFAAAVLPPPGEPVPPDSLSRLPRELPPSDSLLVFAPPQPYTGLIVDARGLELKPSLSPRIVDEVGNELYSARFVDRGYAARWGVVGYDKDLARAAASDRVGGKDAHPLVLAARGVAGYYSADVVLSVEDGVNLQMADLEGDFLAQCRVIFVLGPAPPAGDEVDAAFRDSIDQLIYTLEDSLAADSTRADSLAADSVGNLPAESFESLPEESAESELPGEAESGASTE